MRIGDLMAQWVLAAGVTLFMTASIAQAQTSPQAYTEIKGLLDFVERSHCQFVRNGSEYPGPQARAHLEKKLNYLEGKNKVHSAEDFIELAATKSSMSGTPYQVRCPDGAQTANGWLSSELQRRRQL